jgi:hypothetical protein
MSTGYGILPTTKEGFITYGPPTWSLDLKLSKNKFGAMQEHLIIQAASKKLIFRRYTHLSEKR